MQKLEENYEFDPSMVKAVVESLTCYMEALNVHEFDFTANNWKIRMKKTGGSS